MLGDCGPSEIREPPTNDKADLQHRVDWGGTVWNIKASFQGFLKKVLGWVELAAKQDNERVCKCTQPVLFRFEEKV